MSFTNTRDLIGDQATLDGLVAHTLSEFKENGVDRLGTGALMSNTGLVSVEMPGLSSTSQGANAFVMCTNLVTAAFPDMKRFGAYMFISCSALTTVSAPAVTSGEAYVFKDCKALTNVSFPLMTTLGNSMFAGCTTLSSVTFSTSLSTIANAAFAGCTALKSVNFPNVKTIGTSAFVGCTALTAVSFPAATTVSRSAFYNAPIAKLVLPLVTTMSSYITNLATEIDLSAKPSIAANAFANDVNLFSLILRNAAMLTLANVNALSGTPIAAKYGKIYVPNDLVSTYKAGSNWVTYADQIESLDNYSDGSPTGGDTITDTWSEIFTAENDGSYTSKYSVGDTKWLKTDGGYVLMQIIAMGADELADGSGNAKITWLCKGSQGQHHMNPTSDATNGWVNTEMRAWLISDVLAGIDPTVRAAIKTVKKTYKMKTPSATTATSNDDIWLPSYREMFGGTSYETDGCTYTAFFTDDASRIKYSSWTTGSANNWWLRSASSATNFAFVSINGDGYYSNASSAYGVVFGFCT